jgi:hypothetical protein
MKKLLSIAGLVGAIGAFGAIGAWISQAEEDHEQVRSNQEQIQSLTKLHEAIATKEEAERELLRKLCISGKIDREECEEEGIEVLE